MTRRLIFLLILVGLVLFPYGPLFPWSPLKPGYEQLHFNRADIYYPSGTQPDAAYRTVDDAIADAEKFHGVTMPRRVTVVLCQDWSDFTRYMPQIRGRAVAAVTLATGTVIYVTPKIREKGLDAGEFLRHELSHAALNQNQSLYHAYRLSQQQWFAEGMAVWFGHQRTYGTGAELEEYARAKDLWPLFDGSEQANMRLAYRAWRYFLDYTQAMSGRDPFLKLERGCMERPAECRDVYRGVYGQALQDGVMKFQAAIRAGAYVAKD